MKLNFIDDYDNIALQTEIMIADTIGFSPLFTPEGNQMIILYQLETDFMATPEALLLPMRIIISHEDEMWEYYAQIAPYDIIKKASGKTPVATDISKVDPKVCSYKMIRVNKDVDPGCNYVVEFGVSPDMVFSEEGDQLFPVKFNTNDSTPGWGFINVPMLGLYCEAICKVRGY